MYARNNNPIFVIPTYRLRDVGETIEKYDENFWRNGHALDMIIFDDSTFDNHQKYYPLLEQTKTYNDVYYVGPREKEQFIQFLNNRLRDQKLDSLVKNLFRPSYGGNRNFTLMYTLGHLMISADDDMRPHALIEDSPESLSDHEVSRGKLVKASQLGYAEKSFDILSSFLEVLGKTVADVPRNFEKGEFLLDSAMHLETNASKGLVRENSLTLYQGSVSENAVVKLAQTFRSGTNDIDAIDFAEMYLDDEQQINIDALKDVYVLVNFRPAITNLNWRMDCGVAGYDNRSGLPPFFPTRLRFEDYIYRLWIQQDGMVAAHVDAAQTHIKNNYMRHPLAAEIFNEEISNLLKTKIKSSLLEIDELSIKFDYQGEVISQDTEEILTRIQGIYRRVLEVASTTKNEPRKQELQLFAANLEKSFYGFESDFFQYNVARIVDDVISQIKASIELWSTLVEICYFRKHIKDLPQTKVKNQKRH